MYEKTKAGTGATVADFQNQIIAGSNQKIFNFDFRKKASLGQCLKCRSDYMKFAVEGICQNCWQRIEFVVREQIRQARQKYDHRGGNPR